MGNSQAKGQVKVRQKKQVHWKAAERPGPPGKPELVSAGEITPDVVTIRWDKPKYDGGSPITGYLVEHRRTGSPHWVRATPLLVQLPELTLSGLEPGWRYQFRITAQNVVGMSDPGEMSEPLTVTLQRSVITAPKFTEELKDTTGLENEMAEFVVHVIGQPPPKICWFKDGFEIFSSRRTRIITENDKSVLTIHQVALADEGEIKCTATNKAGHVSSKAIVKVEAPPVIRLPRQYEDGLLFELDEVIRLKVSIAGRPQPLIFWSHNGETIQINDRYEITNSDKSSILKVGEAKRSDRGEYQIRAVNKLGEDSTSFLVTVTDKPRPPKDLKVIMSLGKTVTLSWGIPEDDGGCKIGNYIVEYYRIGWNVWLKASTCRQLTTTLSELIEGSEYKFRVKAESPYGVSDPSDETDVIFIPDPKRGLLSPPARSRSHTREATRETSPVPPKRRSTSSTRQANREQSLLIPSNIAPTPPKREKIRSPQKSPESSPLANRKYMFDRSSLARELAYGSPPDEKYKKPYPEPKPEEISKQENKTSSPIAKRDRSPSIINQILSFKEITQRERSSSIKNQLVPEIKDTPAREKSPSRFNQLLSNNNGPSSPRDRSPSIINTLLSNILPKKSPSSTPSPSPPQQNSPTNNSPSPAIERKDSLVISSLKGDHLDRLSPIIVNRRLSSPNLEQREKSPSPQDIFTRNRSPSLVDSMLDRTTLSPQQTQRNRSPSPSKFSVGDDSFRRGSLQTYQNNNDLVHGSSEFMLVLVDDQGGAEQDYYMFEDSLIPPPLSLSAPELGAECELFMPIKTSVSSTELLHERAFARFAKEAEEYRNSADGASVVRRVSLEKNEKLKITEIDERRQSIPKILINSPDNEEIVGLERKSSFKRRLSGGVSNLAQHYWAKRRHSLRNTNNENSDLYDIKSKFSDNVKDISRERSISEEKEEIIKHTSENFEREHSLIKPEDNKRQESVDEESIYSEEEESDDERLKYDLSPPHIQPDEEDTYHPRMMNLTTPSKYEEPFEILTKPLPMPDPNVIPKPILKRKELEAPKKPTPEKPARKFLTSPGNDRSLSPLPTRNFDRSRSPSPSVNLPQQPTPVPVTSIQKSQMISAAEAAKEKRVRRQSSDEESKAVADYYMDLVRDYGSYKKSQHLYLDREALKSAAEHENIQKSEDDISSEKESNSRLSSLVARHEASRGTMTRRNPSPCPPRRPLPTENKTPEPKPKPVRSRSSSRTRTRDSSTTKTTPRDTSSSRTITVREPSATRAGRTTKRDTSATRTNRREISNSRTRKRDISNSRTSTPTTTQEKLMIISRTPSPRPLTPEQEALQVEAEMKIKSSVDYMTDLAMFVVACWLYLFKDPRLAIPILIIMVYRQIKDEVTNMIPAWMMKKKQ